MLRLESLPDDVEAAAVVAMPTRVARTLGDMLRTPPHLRGDEVIEEIEHALTKWSKYGVDMPRVVRLELCKYVGFAAFAAGETIFKQGDTGEHFYIILTGAVDVSVHDDDAEQEDKVVAHLLAGASFGELALMQGHGQRRATCRCSQKSELFVVNIKDFKRILQPLQQDTLQSKIAFLHKVPMFQTLPASVIESLAVVLTEKVYPPKAAVFYQGNEVEDLFFIQRGHVKMVRETEMEPTASAKRSTNTRPGTSPASSNPPSSIPAWLLDRDPKSSPGSSSAECRQDQSSPRPSARSRRAQANAGTQAAASSYHTLSLELIKSMSGDKSGLEGRATVGRSGRRPPASAGSRRTLHPANSAFQITTSRPTSGLAAQRRQTTCRFADDVNQQAQEKEAREAAAATKKNWLLSEQTLDKQVVQGMDFTRNLKLRQHLFLEVEYLSKHEYFGDVSVTKTPIAQATAVASTMTTTLLVISKWDLVKRIPQDLLDYLADRAKASAVDDNAMRLQYTECQEWLRFRKVLVADVIHQRMATRSNNPIYIWQGGFREQVPCKDPEQVLWKPTGLARNSPYVCY
ncbi:hypothetical protein WJX77_000810 [Trebouxia sp. C0004]